MHPLIEYIRSIGRFQRNARLYLISNALSGTTLGILLVLYNLYLISLGYRTDFIGLVLFIGTLGGGLTIFPAGFCVDRYGGKRILIGSSILLGIAGAGQILFRTPIPLLISGFIVGIGGAFALVVNTPFLSANSTPEERPHLFSLNIVVTLATTVLGEALGGVLPTFIDNVKWLMAPLPSQMAWVLAGDLTTRSYQLALLCAGLIAAPSFIPLFLMHDDYPIATPATSLSQRVQRLALRQRILAIVNHPQKREAVSTLLASPVVGMIGVLVLIYLGAGLFIPYFNIYFVQHLGASPALFGFIDGGANALNAILTLLAPLLARRLGKIATITLTRLLSVPLMLVIGLTGSLPLAAALYPLRQGLMDMSLGIVQVFSMEIAPLRQRGLVNSGYQVATQGAVGVATPIGGLIIAHLGFPPVFIIAAVFYILAIALLWRRFGHDRKDYRGEEVEERTGTNIVSQ